jgi:hypothetical protein
LLSFFYNFFLAWRKTLFGVLQILVQRHCPRLQKRILSKSHLFGCLSFMTVQQQLPHPVLRLYLLWVVERRRCLVVQSYWLLSYADVWLIERFVCHSLAFLRLTAHRMLEFRLIHWSCSPQKYIVVL